MIDKPPGATLAADRQMAHLRTFQAGRQGPLSQKLLNEVAAAKICLLQREKKAAYDVQLGRSPEARAPEKEAPVTAEPKPKPEVEKPSHSVAKTPPPASVRAAVPSPPPVPASAEPKRLPIPSQADQDRAMKLAQDI